MLPHHAPLVLVERAGLVQDPLGNPDLADVMEQRGDLDRVELGTVVAEPLGECDRDVGDALGVGAGVIVLRLHAPRERGDRLEVPLAHLRHEPGTLDRRGQLGQDRVADPVPPLALEAGRLCEVEGADACAAGDQTNPALAVAQADLRSGARQP